MDEQAENSDDWVEAVLTTSQAVARGVVLLDRVDVDEHGSLAAVLEVAERHDWRVVEAGNGVLVLRSSGRLRVLR